MTIMLSKRLQTIASFLPKGAYFADIGTDHAYLPCYVCLKDADALAIAGEFNEGPYRRAKATVDSYNLTEKVDVRFGNGLQIIDAETDPIEQVIIAGMGGPLIRDILKDGLDKLATVKRLILQPNVAEKPLREWLYINNYAIVSEVIVEENNHLYEIIIADYGAKQPYSKDLDDRKKQMMFGPLLLEEKSLLFRKKWTDQLNHLRRITSKMKYAKQAKEQLEKFSRQIRWIEEVLNSE